MGPLDFAADVIILKRMTENTDVLIAGGGIAGLTATLLFAKAGYKTLCVDAGPAPGPSQPTDLRSTAFLMPAIAALEEAGLGESIRQEGAALNTMRLIDAGGTEMLPRETVDFDAADIGQDAFGFNIPNAHLREALPKAIAAEPLAELRNATTVDRVVTRLDSAVAFQSSGDSIKAKLVIAADGRNSQLREAAGITARTTRYGQKAIVFHVTHPRPHDNISTEIHRTGGPFTLVPLAGAAQDRSAIVWMETGAEADRLMALEDEAFAAEATDRSCDVLGPLTLASPRGIWPIISRKAAHLTSRRLALIAEAAHVIPPIGAQGLNMSLRDITTLRDLAKDSDDPGSDAVLAAYEKARQRDIGLRVAGIDLLNRAAMAAPQPLRDLRRAGLKLIGNSPLKTPLMRLGLGGSSS